jgi:Mce-associated membrane protein
MSVEGGSSLDGTETSIESSENLPADEFGRPPASAGSVRVRQLAAVRPWARRCLAKWRSIVATTLVVAAVGFAGGTYLVVYRADQRVSDATAHRVVQAASDGAEAALSYSYEHLHRDLANAKSHLTGDFLTYYDKFAENVVAPTAQKGQLTATAKVIRAAVSDLHPDSAVVLVFVDQTTASAQKKDPEKTLSAVQVTLTMVNGSWLIAKFDPVA